MDFPASPVRDYSVSGMPDEQAQDLLKTLERDRRVEAVTEHHDHTGALAFLRVTLRSDAPDSEIIAFPAEYQACFPDLLIEPNIPLDPGLGGIFPGPG